jgi:uncharacterized phage protein (TIGR02218 family)
MTRTLGGALTSHLATRDHTRAKMMLIACRDGTTLGLTDHSHVLSYDLGTGAVDYKPDTGILPSALSASIGFETGNFEVTGPIGADVTLAGVLGGKWDQARVYLFEVNWKSLGSGKIALFGGSISEARIEGGSFVFEVRSDVDRLNQSIGRVLAPYCTADFCDAQCSLDIADFTTPATLTAVIDALRFTVSYSGTIPDDDLNGGTVLFTSGALMGTKPVEIFDWASTGDVQLFEPLAEPPAIGDTLDLRFGCLKIRKSDDPLARTCMFYGNIANMRAFPEVPGSDQVLKVAVPGAGGA